MTADTITPTHKLRIKNPTPRQEARIPKTASRAVSFDGEGNTIAEYEWPAEP
ncbi:hypothetical protein [Microbacterium jejuense]|uniref:hypothetical protein n=1 Tax=Microbacterium jejuense TaxID=1263637 RepID=UPI0031EF67E1